MTQDTSSRAGRSALLTLILCVLAAMIEGLDIQSAGVAAPRMAPELHLGPHMTDPVFHISLLAYVLTASPFGLLVGAALGGRLADRFGRKSVLVGSMAAYGAFSILTALCGGFWSLLLARLLCGIGLGGALPNLIALTAEASSTGRRNAAVSLMAAGMPLGGVVSSLIALSWPAPGDWRMIFYLGGAAPILLAPLIAFALPESRRFQAAREAGAPRTGVRHALFGGGRAAGTLMAGVSFFCAFLILYLLQNWMPSLMVGKGFSKPEAFQIQGAFNVGGAAGAVVLGWLMDRSHRWIVIGLAYAGMAASLFALGGMGHALSEALLVGLVVGVCVTGSQLIQYGLTSALYATPFRGTGVGFAVALGRFGSVVGPLGAGALVGAGKDASQVLTALLPVAVVGGLAAIGLSLRRTAED